MGLNTVIGFPLCFCQDKCFVLSGPLLGHACYCKTVNDILVTFEYKTACKIGFDLLQYLYCTGQSRRLVENGGDCVTYIQIIALFYAAVEIFRKLRFSVDVFYFFCRLFSGVFGRACSSRVSGTDCAACDLYSNSAGSLPKRRHTVRQIQIAAFILLVFLSACGCSSGADEPVLEPVPTAENADPSIQSRENSDSEKEEKDESGIPDPAGQGNGSVRTALNSTETVGQGNDSAESAMNSSDIDGQQENGNSQKKGDQSKKGEQQKETAVQESDDQRAFQKQVTVHVCGAVRKEGVYVLPEGSRIRDAVEAAGGFSDDADRSFLNLAMQIEDAWQIRVPSREETESLQKQQGDAGQGAASVPAQENPGVSGIQGNPGITDGSDSPFIAKGRDAPGDLSDGASQTDKNVAAQTVRINLNTASKEELMQIPGVGEAKAQRIIDYRRQNGRFETIEDLMKVPGIKNASFQKMKEYITV